MLECSFTFPGFNCKPHLPGDLGVHDAELGDSLKKLFRAIQRGHQWAFALVAFGPSDLCQEFWVFMRMRDF
jgi:hypothetical protein